MAGTGQVVHQPVQAEDGPTRLYQTPKLGAAPHELGEPVRCKCGNERWNVELVGEAYTDDDGYPAQNAKYTCSECGGSLHNHAAAPAEG